MKITKFFSQSCCLLALLLLTQFTFASETIPTDRFVKLKMKNADVHLDVAGANYANGANICVWDEANVDSQKWWLSPITKAHGDDQYYHIVNKHTGKLVDVAGQTMAHKGNVFQYTYTGLPNQEFKFVPVEGERGKYRLQARHSSLYLDMDTYRNIMQFTKGNSWQIWEIIVTDDFIEDGRPSTEIQNVIIPDLTTKAQSNEVTRYTIGYTKVPFFRIVDPAKHTNWQVQNSPYYYLENTREFSPLSTQFKVNDTQHIESINKKIKVGMVQVDKKNFTSTTSIELNYGTGAFSAKAQSELRFESESSTTQSHETTIDYLFQWSAYSATAYWSSKDIVTLKDRNGNLIKNWTIENRPIKSEFPIKK